MAEVYLDFNKAIDGEQLSQELNGVSVSVVDGKLRFVGNVTEKEAIEALSKHTPKVKPEPTIAEKLSSVGLSIDDLKAALGL